MACRLVVNRNVEHFASDAPLAGNERFEHMASARQAERSGKRWQDDEAIRVTEHHLFEGAGIKRCGCEQILPAHRMPGAVNLAMSSCISFPEEFMNEIGVELQGVGNRPRLVRFAEAEQVEAKYSE
jgi:hypothetical protein